MPEADPDAWAKTALESARKEGLSETQAQELAQSERREALISQKGRLIESTLDFVRIGDTVLCNTNYFTPDYNSDTLEYSNGVDSLSAQTRVHGKMVTPTGTLMRDPDEVLRLSAGSDQMARLLLGIPLNQSFGPRNPTLWEKDASLQKSPDGNWIVERPGRIEDRRSQDPDRLIFGGQGTYLRGYQRFDLHMTLADKKVTMSKGPLQSSVIASGFKEHPGGIWFPSKVVFSTPNLTWEYTLIQAQFNDDVDPNGLALPPNLRVADARFGLGRNNIVIYQTSDGTLLDDEEVKARMGR